MLAAYLRALNCIIFLAALSGSAAQGAEASDHSKSVWTQEDLKEWYVADLDEEMLEKVCELSLNYPSILMYRLLTGAYGKISLGPLLGSLRECHNCRLDRLDHSQKRNNFEDKVIADIQEFFPNKKEALNIVSFASGYLFQEFILVNKLYYRGYTDIRLSFIDPLYNTTDKQSRVYGQADTQGQHSILKAMRQFVHYFSSLKNIRANYHFDIKFYANVEDYLSALKEGGTAQADVIFNIDSSVHDFSEVPTSEIAKDLYLLREKGMASRGWIYTLHEDSSAILVAHKTAAEGKSVNF